MSEIEQPVPSTPEEQPAAPGDQEAQATPTFGRDRLRRMLFAVIIVIAVVGLDQLTKEIARRTLAFQPPVELMGGFVRFMYIENTGAFLGLGMTLPAVVRFWVFVVGTGMLLPVILLYAIFAGHLVTRQVIALSLIAAGGIGNMIDRVFNDGAVVDFCIMGTGSIHTGVFNLADMAITAGVFLVVLTLGGKKHHVPEPQPAIPPPTDPSASADDQEPSRPPA